MALDLKDRAQRRMRWVVLVMAGVIVLLAGALVALLVGGTASEETRTEPEPSGEAPADGGDEGPGHQPTETATPSGDYVAPEEWVRLPAGETETSGLPTGFPHTPEGAAAAVAASTRNSWTWDAAQVERGAEVYACEEDRDEILDLADESASGVREYVGLPATGDIPQDAALHAWPIGVQWEPQDEDTVRVSLLIRLAFTPGEGEPTETHLLSSTNEAVWEGGDWAVCSVRQSVAQDAPEAADIGTADFNDAGWVAIQEGENR